MLNRLQIQQCFVRICKDSNWQISMQQATELASKVLNITTYEIWAAFSGAKPALDTMAEIAKGEHMICKDENFLKAKE